MSFALESQPANYISAYKPVLWSFTSSYYPQNQNAGEYGIAIIEIRAATDDDIDNYGVLEGDVLMFFDPTPSLLYPHQQITITNMDDGVYDGLQTVRRLINDGLVVLETEDTQGDTGGTFEKTYERYTLIASVKFSGLADPVRYELKPDSNGVFTMNLMDAAQRGFSDILSNPPCRPGLGVTNIATAHNYITQDYSITLHHGYIVTGEDSGYEFVEISKGILQGFPEMIVVNAVQPDNHVDIDGTVELSWQQDLDSYKFSLTSDNRTRFLTYAPRGQTVGIDDDVFLAFLWTGDVSDFIGIKLVVTDEDTTTDTDILVDAAPAHSGVIRVGPRNIVDYLSDTSVSYTVQLTTSGGTAIGETFHFTIDRKCGEAYIRPQALNPLGGIDSIGFNIRERNGMSVERFTISKPNMEVNYSEDWVGDFNRRTWGVEMTRTFGVSSKPQSAVNRKWFGENIFPSPDVRIPINDSRWTPIIITTRDLALYTSEEKPAPIRFDFMLGTDNRRQWR